MNYIWLYALNICFWSKMNRHSGVNLQMISYIFRYAIDCTSNTSKHFFITRISRDIGSKSFKRNAFCSCTNSLITTFHRYLHIKHFHLLIFTWQLFTNRAVSWLQGSSPQFISLQYFLRRFQLVLTHTDILNWKNHFPKFIWWNV